MGGKKTIDCFHNLPKDSVEVVVYGSSHAFNGINTMLVYNDYGIGSYDYAWKWQRLNTTRMFVEDSLYYQTPKVAVIDTYYINFTPKQVVELELRNTFK